MSHYHIGIYIVLRLMFCFIVFRTEPRDTRIHGVCYALCQRKQTEYRHTQPHAQPTAIHTTNISYTQISHKLNAERVIKSVRSRGHSRTRERSTIEPHCVWGGLHNRLGACMRLRTNARLFRYELLSVISNRDHAAIGPQLAAD